MAARENQSLQIALILFVMLTIVLSVTTFTFFRKFEEAEIREKTAVAAAAEAQRKEVAALEDAVVLKKVLGAGPHESRQAVEDAARENMRAVAANFKDVDRHYQQLVKYLHAELASADGRFVDAKQREEQLKTRLAAEEKIKLAEVAQFESSFDKSAADILAEREAFKKDRKKFKEYTDELVKEFAKKQRVLEVAKSKLIEDNQAQARQMERITILNRELIRRLRVKEQYADLPRGAITGVDQRAHVVWLNVGTADGLRRLITFKVLGADEPNLSDGKGKARIEVIRLLDAHLAEARILDDDVTDPILPGDQIFSKVWVPGRAVHFALAGLLDLDGDHESDRKRIRNLITASGGIIDAELGDDGKRTGELTLDTRYLIQGQMAADKSTSAALLGAYSSMIREADELGVQKISLGQFLDNIGYVPESQPVSLDGTVLAGDFKSKPLGVGLTPKSGLNFKLRRPTPTSPKPSAY